MSKKLKGATNLSPSKASKRPKVSVVTPPDLVSTEETLDSDAVDATSLNMASRMDMMTSMLIDLSNKVNGQEAASQAESEACHISPVTYWHEPNKTRQQNTQAQDSELEEEERR